MVTLVWVLLLVVMAPVPLLTGMKYCYHHCYHLHHRSMMIMMMILVILV